MAIQDDFTIYPLTKVIRHVSGTTVYSAQAFYSWLMDTFDEPGYMTYEAPMRYNTPTQYVMINGWFLDNGDGSEALKYLTGGSILTTGYSGDVRTGLYDTVTSAFVATDKDKELQDDAAAVGPLLSYNATLGRYWVRDTETHGNIVDGSALTVPTGTGDVDANGASLSGDEIYSNPFTLASFPGTPDPQVYIFQNGERVSEWSGLTNWDRGTIDVLIPVQYGGASGLIDSGNITVYVRQTGDSFTFAEADLSAGNRTPVAVETSADTANVTKGEHYLLYDTSDTGSFSVGDVIDNGPAAGAAPTFYAEVVAVTEFAVNTTGILTLRGLRGTIADTNAIYVSGTQEALANGTPGDTWLDMATTVDPTVGDTLTGNDSGAKRIVRGLDAAEEIFVCQVDTTVTGTSRDAYYIDFTTADNAITSDGTGSGLAANATSITIVSGYDDVTVGHINGTVVVDTFVGTFQVGERVSWTSGEAIMAYTDGSTTMTLANVTAETNLNVDTTQITGDVSGATCDISGTGGMTDTNTQDYNFAKQAVAPYSVLVEGGALYNTGRTLGDIYMYLNYILRDGSSKTIYTSTGAAIVLLEGQEYIKADAAYSATKPAPFGTLAGVLFQGAQGVWVQGQSNADVNNLSLTDDVGTAQAPDPTITLTINNTESGDAITMYLDDGAGEPDKTQFTSHATNNVQSDSTFEMSASLPNDTPDYGTVIVVDNAKNEEHRYRYDSWTGAILTLAAEVTGTADGSTAGVTLQDTGNFAAGVQQGDIIRNTLDASWGYIVTVDNANQVTTTQMRDASGVVVPWAVSDTYEINSLVETYDGSDTAFVPYIDEIAAGATVTVNTLYISNRNVVYRARNNDAVPPIQPFVATGTINSNGITVSVIRTEDTVTS